MIALVEGAERQKTPNEIALNILIAGLTLIFLLAVVTLQPIRAFSVAQAGAGSVPSVAVLVSLLVCLIPTTIGGLLSAIGIAGMDRVMQHNVLAMSGKAVEASGDVNTLLLDKTGTITLGNRQAVEFIPVDGRHRRRTGRCRAACPAWPTKRRRAARSSCSRKRSTGCAAATFRSTKRNFIPFSAYTRMSGVDIDGRQLRKGATEAIAKFVSEQRRRSARQLSGDRATASRAAAARRWPWPTASALLGVIHLKDIVKGGMKERIAQLRAHGHPQS